ncbi:MAG: response regulator transcription factor, partial [Polyangiaceae bacterium]
MPRADLIALVESIYAAELRERDWLLGIAVSARSVFGGRDLGAYAITYDASDISDCRFGKLVPVAIESQALRRILTHDLPRAYRSEPRVVDAVFRKTPYGVSRDLPLVGAVQTSAERMKGLGVANVLGLNGVSVDGHSAHVGVLMTGPTRAVRVELLARLSSHLAAGFRLRARVGAASRLDRAEAILSPSGGLEHVAGAAKLREARLALAQAAARIERLRSATRVRDPERAVIQWRALVDARWSLVDHFEQDGKRYLLAERNDATTPPIALLSARERQVVALAALGHANKMIGYELGISVSTAGVLLSRAAKKLGVRSRAALIEAYETRGEAKTRFPAPSEGTPSRGDALAFRGHCASVPCVKHGAADGETVPESVALPDCVLTRIVPEPPPPPPAAFAVSPRPPDAPAAVAPAAPLPPAHAMPVSP